MLPKRRKTDLCNYNLAKRLKWLILKAQTESTRFWFSLTSIGFGYFMLYSPTAQSAFSEYSIMLQWLPYYIWGILFTVHGVATLYGVLLNKCTKLLLVLEGILGVLLWATAGFAVTIAQSALGAIIAGTLIAFWLLVRYPTNKEYLDGL